jgi:hypothetical protein
MITIIKIASKKWQKPSLQGQDNLDLPDRARKTTKDAIFML